MCHVSNFVHKTRDNVTFKIFHENVITQRFLLRELLLLFSFKILN